MPRHSANHLCISLHFQPFSSFAMAPTRQFPDVQFEMKNELGISSPKAGLHEGFGASANQNCNAKGLCNDKSMVGNGYGNGEIATPRNVRANCVPVMEFLPNREDEISNVLQQYLKDLREGSKYHIGYPCNLDFDYSAVYQLLEFNLNNAGDPFIKSNSELHSRHFEIGVLDWFAGLWELKRDEYWGYVTTGGTEGNMHGILVGRELHPEGILYTSRDSHYSVFETARMFRMQLEEVDTLVSGEIDCSDFKQKLLKNKGKPAIVNVNIGTTVKGAVDDLDLVVATLEEAGLKTDQFYIHCDGALFGFMLPFLEWAPTVNFKKAIGSISVSGHKFIGCPMPCGVQMIRMEHIRALSRDVEYIGTKDATIMGSRNGHLPVFLWYTLSTKGYQSIQKEVQECLKNAQYLKNRLENAEISVMLNKLSCTVVFERPIDEGFVLKWQLACQGNIAHVVVMQNVTVTVIDCFVDEFAEKRKGWFSDGKIVSRCIAEDVGDVNCACLQHRHLFSD